MPGTKKAALILSIPGDNSILVDRDCESEINDIVRSSGQIVRFSEAYKARINMLREYREKAPLFNRQWFEKLKYLTNPSLYSMHLASIGNMRIIYVIGKRIILLCAFKEKGEHGKKHEGYTQYIPIAQNRLERYKEV